MIPFAFLNNKFKWPGLLLVVSGYVLNGILHPDMKTVTDGWGLLIQVMILTGLLIIICSKQKTEDEFINHYRMVSLQWAVIIIIALRLAWKTIGYATGDESWMPQWQVNSLLLFYLVLFYYHCFIKPFVTNLLRPANEK